MAEKSAGEALALKGTGIVHPESYGVKRRISMKRSLLQWRRQTGMILPLSAFALAAATIIFALTASLPTLLASGWFWISLALLLVIAWFHFGTRSLIDELRNDIDELTSRASAISKGLNTSTVPSDQHALIDLERLSNAIDEMAEKAKRDILELKRLEQVRSEFLGNVSHELRTPIFSVQGYLETLLDGAIDDPNVRDEFLEKAHNNMLRLHSLLNDLIEISRIESGAMKMSFRYFDLASLAQSVIASMESPATLANVSLNLEIAGKDKEGKIMTLGDRKRIEQALVNLVTNAIKYNRPEGDVFLILSATDSAVTVTVRDTGIGIPSEQIGRIFERFYRVDKGRSRDVGGTGLGLAIVKHIIEAHGCRIEVESVPDSGTSFSFSLSRDD